MQWRREQPENPSRPAIELGMKESRAAGVAAIGEITTGGTQDLSSCYSEDDQGSAVVSFREAIGLRPGRIQEQLETARRHLATPVPSNIIRDSVRMLRITVHPDLLSGLASLAQQHQAPLAMHLAETSR